MGFDEAEKNFTEKGEADSKYTELYGCWFHNEIFKRRMQMTIEPFLLYANSVSGKRKDGSPKGYVHVVGLGIGAWALNEEKQTDLMLEVYNSVILQHRQRAKA